MMFTYHELGKHLSRSSSPSLTSRALVLATVDRVTLSAVHCGRKALVEHCAVDWTPSLLVLVVATSMP